MRAKLPVVNDEAKIRVRMSRPFRCPGDDVATAVEEAVLGHKRRQEKLKAFQPMNRTVREGCHG